MGDTSDHQESGGTVEKKREEGGKMGRWKIGRPTGK